MPKRRTAPRGVTGNGRHRHELSVAFLLPDLHPWLKEFFSTRNLVPLRDEAWDCLPVWEPLVSPAAIEDPESAHGEYPGLIAVHAVSPVAVSIRADEQSMRATAAAPQPLPTPPIAIPEVPPPNSSNVHRPPLAALPTTPGIRASAAPTPFVIPVHAASTAEPSRHALRILRPLPATAPHAAAPNLLGTYATRITELPARTRTYARMTGAHATACLRRVRNALADDPGAAPWPTIGYPANELLVVTVTIGTIAPLWRAAWPAIGRILHAIRGRRAQEIAAPLRPWRFPFALPQLAWTPPPLAHAGRHAATFAIVLAVVILPVHLLNARQRIAATQGRVLGATATAVASFRAGGSALASSSFADAVRAFDAAHDALVALPNTLTTLERAAYRIGKYVPGMRSTVERAERLRRAGATLAAASSATARALDLLASTDLADARAADRLAAVQAAFVSADTLAADARDALASSAPALVADVDRARGLLGRAESLVPILGALGGVDAPRRILLVFQNPAELRPTGGFMGSIALLDVRGGAITALEVPGGGSYDLSGISRARVLPPEPLRLLTETWQFHDANWFPDFPATARKLRWFATTSGAPSVDAVVAVNASVLEDLLRITGPITAGGRAYTASDALTALTNAVEDDAARASGTPKAVVGELAPELLRRLLAITRDRSANPADRLAVAERVLHALGQRDILIAFNDDRVQRYVAAAGWTGAIVTPPHDGLFVVHTNVGGGKTDRAIRDAIAHVTDIAANGTITDTVTITRTHEGGRDPLTTTAGRLTAMVNRDYLRIYVPRGAELLAISGAASAPAPAEPVPTDAIPDTDLLAVEREQERPFPNIRITEEFGRTAFGAWLITPPNAQSRITFTYRIPTVLARTRTDAFGRTIAADAQAHSLYFQRQPGTRATVQATIRIDPAWRPAWVSENLRPEGPNTWTLNALFTNDRLAGMMIAPNDPS